MAVATTIGTGAHSLVLRISEDAYQGDAQYNVAVDGVQVGSTLTAQALHGSGQSDSITVLGDWGLGTHNVTLTFLNDAYAGTPSTDRNLYLDGATYDGAPVGGASATLLSAGPASFSFTETANRAPATTTIGAGPDTLVLLLSEDAYQGDAQFTLSVDGVQIGGVLTAQALHGSGEHDSITLLGDWAVGSHAVSINFLNDAYAGTPSTDRNLYLDGATYDGAPVAGGNAVLASTGPDGFSFTDTTAQAPVSNEIGSGPDSLVLLISEDAYQGDAQYTVSVDGVQIGGTLTAHGLHAVGQHDTLTVHGDWGPGAHSVSINFLNDAYAGTPSTDRNLYLDGSTYNGAAVPGGSAVLASAGPAGFGFTDASGSTPISATIGSGAHSLVLKISEDAYQGDAQYTVSVDGVQVGGVLTAHAAHAAGQDDTITVLGDWAPGAHSVSVNFLNDAYDGTPSTDRNLYLDGATLDGTAIGGANAVLASSGPASFSFNQPGVVSGGSSGASSGAGGSGGALVGQHPGYTVVMADDFSHGYDKSHWGDPFPLPWANGPSSNGAYIWDSNAVRVVDGELQIVTSLQSDGWHTTGFNSFKAGVGIHYGTMDFDAKVDAAQGTVSAFLMWPMTDTWPPEIDILETPKNQAMHTLHWGNSGADASIQFGGPDPSQWHHYTLTWLPGLVQIATDGQVTASWDYNSPDVPMGFGALGLVGSPWDGWMGGPPDSTTPTTVITHLDNVVMQQWNGASGPVPPTPSQNVDNTPHNPPGYVPPPLHGPRFSDGLGYIASYDDLIAALPHNRAAGENHFQQYGNAEGRHQTFHGLDYIASYDDLMNAYGANSDAGALHWMSNGRAEGRHESFNGLDYIASYDDLIAAFGANADAGAAHWITHGRFEGRHATFHVEQYLANYADLRAAFGTDTDAALMHYITNGHAEGRTDHPLL